MTEPLSGLLLVDKSPGWTSHDVVAVVRKLYPKKTKVGHCGTLDPMATGLLILLIGRATKASSDFLGLPKSYSGTVRLGLETDTGDMEGNVLHKKDIPHKLNEVEIKKHLKHYRGDIELPIPAYSAVKHKGRPLYEYARKGIETPIKMRTSRIQSWELTQWAPPEFHFLVHCSSGTYVRALATDIGKRMGCGGALSALRRETIGDFTLDGSRTIEEIRALGKAPELIAFTPETARV